MPHRERRTWTPDGEKRFRARRSEYEKPDFPGQSFKKIRSQKRAPSQNSILSQLRGEGRVRGQHKTAADRYTSVVMAWWLREGLQVLKRRPDTCRWAACIVAIWLVPVMCPRSLDVDDFLGLGDRVDDSVFIGQAQGVTACKVPNESLAFVRSMSQYFGENSVQLVFQF